MRLIGFLRTIALGAVIFVVIIWAKGASAHHIAADILRLELALLGVWTGWIILALLAWLCTGETRGSGKTGSAGPGSSNRLPVDWKSGQEVEPDLSSLFPPLRSTQPEEGPQALIEENHLINDLSLVPCVPAARGPVSRYSR